MKPIQSRLSTPFQFLLLLTVFSVTLLSLPTLSFGAKAPATLSFNVAARVEAKGSGKNNIVRSTTGRVFLRGQQARIETKVGAQTVVVLFLKPYVYRLLPSSKAGVRYKSNTPSPELQAFFSDWPSLMNQPARIRAALKQKGARKTGTATVSAVATDVYAATRWGGKAHNVKLWLRRSDSLPMRMESNAGGVKTIISWSNYRRGLALSPSLFAVPKGYKVREGQAPRMMS